MIKLNDCRRCGGKAHMFCTYHCDELVRFVECVDCNVRSLYFRNPDDAEKSWNEENPPKEKTMIDNEKVKAASIACVDVMVEHGLNLLEIIECSNRICRCSKELAEDIIMRNKIEEILGVKLDG